MTVYCQTCKSPQPDDATICSVCGSSVKGFVGPGSEVRAQRLDSRESVSPGPAPAPELNGFDTLAGESYATEYAPPSPTMGNTAQWQPQPNAMPDAAFAGQPMAYAGGDPAFVQPGADQPRQLSPGIIAAIVGAVVLVVAAAIFAFNMLNAGQNAPESIGEVRTSYELLEVGDVGALSTMLSFKIGENDMVELANGNVVISGHISSTTQTDDAIVYDIRNLRGGGGDTVISPDDSMKIMIPRAAEKGDVVGSWRLTIYLSGGKYRTLWANVKVDGSAKLGSANSNAFSDGWSPKIGSGLNQIWTRSDDGMFAFTGDDGSQLRVRLTA